MDFDRLRAFLWTVEEGSISAAARRLGRTQPAVSRMLQMLEEQLGARLIDRRARPVALTSAGRRALSQARDILRAAERLAVEARLEGRAQRPVVRLGVSRSLLGRLADRRFVDPPRLLQEVDFAVHSGWSPRLYRRFARGGLDAAVLLMPVTWHPDVPCGRRLLRRERLVVVAPRSARTGAKVPPKSIAFGEVPWLLNPDGCGFRQALTEHVAASGGCLRVRFEIDAAPSEHLALVAAGLGYSIVPVSALRTAAGAKVRRIDVPGGRFTLGVWQVWTTAGRWPGAAIVDTVADVFRTEP